MGISFRFAFISRPWTTFPMGLAHGLLDASAALLYVAYKGAKDE